jgi:hypothetical protein
VGAAHALRTGVVAAVRLVFPTSELTIELFAAIQLLGERIVARGLARMAEAGPEPTTRALLRAAILGALPSDDETSTDALLFLTFCIAAMTGTSLGSADALAAPRQTVSVVIDLIRRAEEADDTRRRRP